MSEPPPPGRLSRLARRLGIRGRIVVDERYGPVCTCQRFRYPDEHTGATWTSYRALTVDELAPRPPARGWVWYRCRVCGAGAPAGRMS